MDDTTVNQPTSNIMGDLDSEIQEYEQSIR